MHYGRILQAILRVLSPRDHAHLRQVSHATRSLTSTFVPFITLQLSESSSTDQLQQWNTATMQMQHVPSVYVLIAGAVQSHVFSAAMQLLSQRPAVKELHLLPARASRSECHIESLQPVAQLAAQLNTLVIADVTVVLQDLEQLVAAAPATGWA